MISMAYEANENKLYVREEKVYIIENALQREARDS